MLYFTQRMVKLLCITSLLAIFFCVSAEKEFKKATEKNNEQAYRNFIASHPDHPLVDEARNRLEILLYNSAIDSNNIKSFEKFLSEFPDGNKSHEVKIQLERLYLNLTREEGTIKAYEFFIEKFPNGELIDSASTELEKIFFDSTEVLNTISAWDKYLAKYPDGKFTTIARNKREMLEIYQISGTVLEIYCSYLGSYYSVDGATIFLQIVKDREDKKFCYVISNEQGKITNPSGISDENGRFTIHAPYSYIKNYREFTVGTADFCMTSAYQDNKLLIIRFNKKNKKIELREINLR